MLGGMVKNGIGLGLSFMQLFLMTGRGGGTPASHGHNSLLLPQLKV